jgi:hypothetical protein
MQSRSNQSPTQITLITGKITGNFIDSGPLPQFRRPVGERIQWLAAKFPKQWNREVFSGSREFFGANREIAFENSGLLCALASH